METSVTSQAPAPSQLASRADKPPRNLSCVRCFERKVKCDKQYPCAGCVRSNVECVIRVLTGRRRTKQVQAVSLLNQLKHYSDVLRSHGIDVAQALAPPELRDSISNTHDTDAADKSPGEVNIPGSDDTDGTLASYSPSFIHDLGRLIVDEGRTRFVEGNLWATLSDEFRQPKEAIPDSSEDEDDDSPPRGEGTDIILGAMPTSYLTFHPSPDHILKLWDIYQTNFNPLTKIVHVPTLTQQIVKGITDLERVPRNVEALMFSIYAAAVLSVSDAECQAAFYESRQGLLSRYCLGAKRALIRAKLIGTSDLTVLQAFTIYLMVMRPVYDSRTLWTLSGAAHRIGQGIGLHRDGTSLGLPPFQVEMRRRLCWQLNLLDFRSSELSGSSSGDINWWGIDSPSNVNDEDIWPEMQEPPVPHTRSTEMVGCLIRYEVAKFWKEKLMLIMTPGMDFNQSIKDWLINASLEERDQFIDDLELRLEEKYLRYCDPSVPVQFMSMLIGRMVCKSMRIMAHHPRRYKPGEVLPESEKKLLWSSSLALMEGNSLIHTSQVLQRFTWHADVYFQWLSLIYVLGELTANPLRPEKDQAWQNIDDLFKNHTELADLGNKPLHVALGRLCLKAWKAHEQEMARTGHVSSLPTPACVIKLRQSLRTRDSHKEQGRVALQNQDQLVPAAQQVSIGDEQQPRQLLSQVSSFETTDTSQFPSSKSIYSDFGLTAGFSADTMTMDWAKWDSLLMDFEMSDHIPPSSLYVL